MTGGLAPMFEQLSPCGPVTDEAMAERAYDRLAGAAGEGGLSRMLDVAWPALAPVFGASPYLARLATQRPTRLEWVLSAAPRASLLTLLETTRTLTSAADIDEAAGRLRDLKGDLHLLVALADLGGVWDLEAVTGALSAFADEAVRVALSLAEAEAVATGRLVKPDADESGHPSGLFVIAMGKHGAGELNYSSDIDITVFYDPSRFSPAPGIEPGALAVRLTERLATLLQARTARGYVFRVDLRLRPDPSSTPVAISLPGAFAYYESVGQNWERAALIKARAIAGDVHRGDAFLAELSPFVWRRNLDFAAIADIHAIKRQIHIHKVDDRLTAKGADLKLGRGGIREIEFYVQTQQLILGGRHPSLRSPRTLEALGALARGGQIEVEAAEEMTNAYLALRAWEHRVQMLNDEQTHRLPENNDLRRRVAALAGYRETGRFDAAVGRILRGVNRRYGALFAGEEALSSRFGSLVFTGPDDDPETLSTLGQMGFVDPLRVSGVIRAWHHGQIAATRTQRGREVFTRLAPRVLEAAQATGAPDMAFLRFADFFSGLSMGVQTQSLFVSQPRLLNLIVRVMAFAPRFARTLSRDPAAFDALLDPDFYGPIEAAVGLADRIAAAPGFEAAMNAGRRALREGAFRIGVRVLGDAASAETAGRAFADLADAIISGLGHASLAEVDRTAGAFPGEVAVIALGKCGSREMTARSDLDLMTLYKPGSRDATSAIKGLSAETFYARFTQRLVAALSAPTAEGGLYEVDLQLRPSGTKGPVAVSLAAFEDYYALEAETWELLALTRARVVWASSTAWAADAKEAIDRALRRERDTIGMAHDVREMRELMARERPGGGFWDMKLSEGGLVDIEFCAQYLQLVHAAKQGPLRQNTDEALVALGQAGLSRPSLIRALRSAGRLQQDIAHLLKIALEDGVDPQTEPVALRRMLARAGGVASFEALRRRLIAARRNARAAFERIFSLR